MFLYDLAYITKPLQNSVCPGTAYLIINRLRFPRIPIRESCFGLITGFRRSFKIMSQERPAPLRLCRILPVETGSQPGSVAFMIHPVSAGSYGRVTGRQSGFGSGCWMAGGRFCV